MVPFFVLLHVMSQYEFQNHWRAGIQTAIILEEYSWIDKKIQSLNPFEAYIFSSGGGNVISTQSVRMKLKRICDKLGIYRKSPHKIRKTYILITS